MAAPKTATKRDETGLTTNEDGTATLVSGGKKYDIRRPKTREFTEIRNIVVEADEQYLAEIDSPEAKAEYNAIQAKAVSLADALDALDESVATADRLEIATKQIEAVGELDEATRERSRRIQETFRVDAPHLLAMKQIVEMLTGEDFDVEESEPYLTQPGSLGKLYANFQLPLHPGGNGNGSPNRAERRKPEDKN